MRTTKRVLVAAGAFTAAAIAALSVTSERDAGDMAASGASTVAQVAADVVSDVVAEVSAPIGVAQAQEASDPLGQARIETLKSRGYLIGDAPLGDAEAGLTIIEYASLTCGHCRAFHATSLPELKEQYIDTGKANLVVREVYFDRLGLYASAIARCSGRPAAFHSFVDVFLDKQGEWFFGTDDAAVAQGVQSLRRLGQLGGLTTDRIDACLTDNEFLEHLFASYQKTAGEDNVRATPTLVIGDQRVRGAQAAAAVAEVIDSELGG